MSSFSAKGCQFRSGRLRKISFLARCMGIVHTFKECLDFRQLLFIRQLLKFCMYAVSGDQDSED